MRKRRFSRYLKLYLGCVVVLGIGFVGFELGRYNKPVQRQPAKVKLVDAIPTINIYGCVAANAQEHEILELAVQTLEKVGGTGSSSPLIIGAQRALAAPVLRETSQGPRQVCPPEALYARASDAITTHTLFSPGRLVEYQLQLAAKLPHRSRYIVDAIANSAFNKSPQGSDVFHNQDIRPLARTILAGFGEQAASYADTAYAQISADDALGTGAAQVAIATGHRDAVERTLQTIQKQVASFPSGEVSTWPRMNRLVELSYALYFSGEAAKLHLEPIKDLMGRKVVYNSQAFGRTKEDPEPMCKILWLIEGAQGHSIKNYPYCNSKVPPITP